MLSSIFTRLLKRYTTNEGLIQDFWKEVETHYTSKSRHYHTLQHLQNMYTQLLPVKEQITDWDTVMFALFYHDVVYDATRKDNEERSAALAEKRLQQIYYPEAKIRLCAQEILATQSHSISTDTDTNYFTDADLSVLGVDWPEYEKYAKAIRKEYSMYPDLLYKPGRRKVLEHFLSMERIYKTAYFQEMSEGRAKANMKKELEILIERK